MADTLATAAIENFRHRLVEDYPAQIRRCLESLSEDQIWWRPHDEANAIGNLVLHLCGNVRHYLWRGAGGREYRRDRPWEFSERGPLSRARLVELLDETVAGADGVLGELATADLMARSERTEYGTSLYELAYHVATHFAYHTGQIVYATKLLMETGFEEEIWKATTRVHPREGPGARDPAVEG